MGRRTDDRSIAGHRHQTRKMSESEERRLVELRSEIVRAHVAADDFLIALYDDHVSQQSIADVLGVTQGAVHLRIRKHREWQKARRETGAERAWYDPRALQPRPNRGVVDVGEACV